MEPPTEQPASAIGPASQPASQIRQPASPTEPSPTSQPASTGPPASPSGLPAGGDFADLAAASTGPPASPSGLPSLAPQPGQPRPVADAPAASPSPAAEPTSPAPAATSPVPISSALSEEQWTCPICQDLVWKPCVTDCGHHFCFWCVHQAMDPLQASSCPMCRQPFRNLPAVCMPLQHLVVLLFPEAAEERHAEVADMERRAAAAIRVVVAAPRRHHGGVLADGSVLCEDVQPYSAGPWPVPSDMFRCAACGDMAKPPCVTACGHLFCMPCRKNHVVCMQPGCGLPLQGGGQVFKLLDSALSEMFPREYALSGSAPKPAATGIGAEQHMAILAGGGHRYVSGYLPRGSDLSESVTTVVEALERSNSTPEAIGISWKGDLAASGPVKVWVKGAGCELKVDYKENWHSFVKLCKLGAGALSRLSTRPHIHYGAGCDACGQFPIAGARFKCEECPEEVQLDVCGVCYAQGRHLRVDCGRFDQSHRPEHRMREVPPVPTGLHLLQEVHPELPPGRILELVAQMHAADDASA